jgi:hypothetical protein
VAVAFAASGDAGDTGDGDLVCVGTGLFVRVGEGRLRLVEAGAGRFEGLDGGDTRRSSLGCGVVVADPRADEVLRGGVRGGLVGGVVVGLRSALRASVGRRLRLSVGLVAVLADVPVTDLRGRRCRCGPVPVLPLLTTPVPAGSFAFDSFGADTTLTTMTAMMTAIAAAMPRMVRSLRRSMGVLCGGLSVVAGIRGHGERDAAGSVSGHRFGDVHR